MLKISDLREKEVINVYNGEKLGYIYDFEVDIEKGMFTAIILASQSKGFALFTKASDIIIEWRKIIKIGEDTILVNLRNEE